MRTAKLSAIIFLCASVLLINGCNDQMEQLRIQNDNLNQRISGLQSLLDASNLELEKVKRQLATAQGEGGVEMETLQAKIAALEADIKKKNELIASMQQRLMSGGAALPVELSTLLEDFAKNNNMVERGVNRYLPIYCSTVTIVPLFLYFAFVVVAPLPSISDFVASSFLVSF